MVFASLAADGPTLREHLGDFAFYLGFYTRQSAAGLELRGPQRWRVRANWKIGCENFVGDMYHTPYTHRSVVDVGLFREPKANKRKDGILYFAGAGGGTTYKLPPGDFVERMRYVGYPDEMIERARSAWSPEQVAMVGDDGFMVSAATLFPNLSLVHNWPQVDDAGTVVPFISLRQWQPVSATATVQGLSATVTATPTRLSLRTGDQPGGASCVGPGRLWSPGMAEPAVPPACSYTYQDASTVAPNGKNWPAQLSIRWHVSWTATNGAGADLDDLTTATGYAIPVREIQARETARTGRG
jgi:hypothetical protein